MELLQYWPYQLNKPYIVSVPLLVLVNFSSQKAFIALALSILEPAFNRLGRVGMGKSQQASNGISPLTSLINGACKIKALFCLHYLLT